MPYYLTLTTGSLCEFLLACFLIVAATRADRTGRLLLVGARRIAYRICQRDWYVIALAAALPITIRLIFLAIDPVPQPYVMEEFNHLLEADTYSLGRLSNPVHPLAVMLQSYQQVEWPHYMSGRPPLPALFLFIGETLLNSAFAGNLFAIALTSAALCWMLMGWMSRVWAAIGSYLAICTFCLFGYWVNSFWCPTPIVLGGALLMGVVPRVEREPQLRWAAVFVVGLVLLAGTRPYENGVYSGVIFLWLATRLIQADRRPLLRKTVIRFLAPVSIGGVAIILAQLSYNIATTGNYRLMPYQIWRASQDLTPMFLWQPVGGHAIFYYVGAERFAHWNMSLVTAITHGGLFGIAQLFGRQAVTFRDLLGPMLFLPFLCWSPTWLSDRFGRRAVAPLVIMLCTILFLLLMSWGWAATAIKAIVMLVLFLRWRNADERLPILLLLAGIIATSLSTFYMTIYFSAFTAPLLILAVKGLRHLSRWSPPLGPSLAGFLLLGPAVLPMMEATAFVIGSPLGGASQSHFDLRFPSPRREALAIVDHVPGQHVIFVRSDQLVEAPLDPVWNTADVDKQKIVWLRDLHPSWTAAAQRYYHGRQFWLMEMDAEGHHTLARYPSASLPPPPPLSALPMPDRTAATALGARER